MATEETRLKKDKGKHIKITFMETKCLIRVYSGLFKVVTVCWDFMTVTLIKD